MWDTAAMAQKVVHYTAWCTCCMVYHQSYSVSIFYVQQTSIVPTPLYALSQPLVSPFSELSLQPWIYMVKKSKSEMLLLFVYFDGVVLLEKDTEPICCFFLVS